MKKLPLQLAMVLIGTWAILSCSTTKPAEDQKEWPGMDEFHMVMAESYHPFKDSANLEPAKEQAGSMAQVAQKWAAEPLPARVDNEEVKSKLAKLKLDAASFEATVKAGNDEAIAKSLEDLHNLFHEVQEAWYSSGKAEGEKHDHH